MNRLALVAAAAFALTGCHDFRDDLLIVCDAPDKIKGKVPDDAKTPVKLSAMGQYMWEHVKTKDGKALVEYLSEASRTERSRVLRELSSQYGVPSCHMAEVN
jgi:hypothetical protein